MHYRDVHPAVFVQRENRFIARALIDGREERVHVKNTGRCAELFVPGARIWLEKSAVLKRKTAYDLIAVEKKTENGSVLVNIDSVAPNHAAEEWLKAGGIGCLASLKAEVRVGDSRYDFCAVQEGRPVAVEVKGCTLENDGIARFPDAPTLRGVKHVRGLTALAGQGWRCVILIVIQMKGVRIFRPNWETHPEFGEALLEAQAAGVEILAVDCIVELQGTRIDSMVPVDLSKPEISQLSDMCDGE